MSTSIVRARKNLGPYPTKDRVRDSLRDIITASVAILSEKNKKPNFAVFIIGKNQENTVIMTGIGREE